jgi:GTP pyrophosphokinase
MSQTLVLPPAVLPMETLAQAPLYLVLQRYLSKEALVAVLRAHDFSQQAHQSQRRHSGEPYVYHPLAVAEILASLALDEATIIAALLHDVVEDTPYTLQDIAERFGETVAQLVDGVTKLEKLENLSREQQQAENFRKLLLATSKDLRVILIKLADRLHNLRTLACLPPQKRRRIAKETLEIYAPIAERLGLADWQQELQTLAFQSAWPWRSAVLAKAVAKQRRALSEWLADFQVRLEKQLAEEGIPAEVHYREKNRFSLYQKMVQKRLRLHQVPDLHAFRVITEKTAHCYQALGVAHSLHRPLPQRFKDYIALPKANGYQSLHTTLTTPRGVLLEVQIRTQAMHFAATAGIAAHYLYKNQDANVRHLWQHHQQWWRQWAEQPHRDALSLLEDFKIDLYPDSIYVLTPHGDIVALPKGATVVDFAYALHSDLGHHLLTATVDGETIPLSKPLESGQRVEIVKASKPKPEAEWLNFVVTARARNAIRQYLRLNHQDKLLELGEQLLEALLNQHGHRLSEFPDNDRQQVAEQARLPDWPALLREVALGKRSLIWVAQSVCHCLKGEKSEDAAHAKGVWADSQGLPFGGENSFKAPLAKCCFPIPGDAIVGLLTEDKGLVVHRQQCRQLQDFAERQPERLVPLHWDTPLAVRDYPVLLHTHVRNQAGVLAEVSQAVASQKSNIEQLELLQHSDNSTTLRFLVLVNSRDHLAAVFRAIRVLPRVLRLARL